MPDIVLSKQAGELRVQADAKRQELKAFLTRQVADDLQEGETRMSPEEITEKTAEISGLLSEAESLEKFDSLEGIFSQPADRLSDGAKEIANSANLRQPETKGAPDFPLMTFIKALRTMSGEYAEEVKLTATQKAYFDHLRRQATVFSKGEAPERSFSVAGDLAGLKEAFETKLTGDSGGGAEALVPTFHMTELLRAMGEDQVFAPRARHVPMARRTIDFPRLVQSDKTDTRPMYGFAAISKVGEGVEKGEREPVFEQLTLSAIKYAAYLEAGDELLVESIINLVPLLVELLTGAIGYEYDRDCLRGSGSAEPQGFIGSTAEWEQARKTAAKVLLDDVFGIEERFFGGLGVWYFHPSVIPQLYPLQASNIIVWNPNLAVAAPGTLLGRPLVRSHKLPTLGTKGDFCLVDPSYYLAGDMQAITISNSIHYKFRNDLTAWRAVFRGAGVPWPKTPFSSESSGTQMAFRVSPFCVLGDAATS